MRIANKRNTENERDRKGECLHASETEKNHIVVPQRLNIMFRTVFFKACMVHPEATRNDLNHFCTDCCQPICLNCLAQHMFHNHVKSYHTNKAKVIFLKQRHRSQQQNNNKWRVYMCTICQRSLQDNSLYCSIACEVIAIHGNECQRKALCGSHDFKDSHENKGGEQIQQVPVSKRPKSRRKGVPQRAPMF